MSRALDFSSAPSAHILPITAHPPVLTLDCMGRSVARNDGLAQMVTA